MADELEYRVTLETKDAVNGASKVDGALDGIAASAKKTDKNVKLLNTSMKKTAVEVKKATGAFGLQKGAAQQLGFQLQDVAVTAQMGASWFTILGQQGSQLAGILGPGGALLGAIIAISAAIGGVLVKSINLGKDAITILDESLLALDETIVDLDGDTAKLSKELTELAKRSVAAAKIEMAIGLRRAGDAADQAKQALVDFTTEMGLLNSLSSLNVESLKNNERALSRFEARVGTSVEEMEKLKTAQEKAISSGDADDIRAFADAYSRYAIKAGVATDESLKISKGINDIATKAEKAKDVTDLLESAMGDLATELDKSSGAAEKADKAYYSLISSLETQIIAMTQGEEAAKRHSAEMILGAGASEERRKAVKALMDQIHGLTFAEQIAAAAAAKRRKEEQDAENKKKGGKKFAQKIVDSAKTPAQVFQEQLDQLDLLREKDLANEQLYLDAKAALTKKYDEQQKAQSVLTTNAMLASSSQLFDGLSELAKTFGSEQSAAYKAAFALSKGFAVAQAGLNLSLAISQALADPTAITLPQKFANYAAIASAGGGLVSAIASASFGGGRLNGGPLESGKLHPFMEDGRPEAVMYKGKMHMYGGDGSGSVVSNKDLTSGGNVTINNAPPDYDYNVSRGGGGVTIDMVRRIAADEGSAAYNRVADDFSQNTGRVWSAATSNSNVASRS